MRTAKALYKWVVAPRLAEVLPALLAAALLSGAAYGADTPADRSASDAQISHDVRKKIDEAGGLKNDRIGVRTVDGVVYLEGSTGTADEKRLAEALARNVPGVRQVESDELEVTKQY